MLSSDPTEEKGDREILLHVGDVVGTHGLRGDLKVRLHSGDPSLLLAVDKVTLHPPSGVPVVARISRQVTHKGMVLLRLHEYESIALAEPLVGSRVKLPKTALPELEEDEYYWETLADSRVIDRRYGDLGRLVRIFTTAAHDTYVVEGRYGEVLIPAVKNFVVSIDPVAKLIEVDLPDGLVPEQE